MTTRYIGTMTSVNAGELKIHALVYVNGGLAIRTTCEVTDDDFVFEEPYGTLSVNMGDATLALPPDCFYAKTWAENAIHAAEALASGWFEPAPEFPSVQNGYVLAPVWRLRKEKGEPWVHNAKKGGMKGHTSVNFLILFLLILLNVMVWVALLSHIEGVNVSEWLVKTFMICGC